ncbi:MAG: hypothetical protein R2771_07610 [Saprospiraceae bacterium]
MPELIFDHNIMVTQALRSLIDVSSKKPIGFEYYLKNSQCDNCKKLYKAIMNHRI